MRFKEIMKILVRCSVAAKNACREWKCEIINCKSEENALNLQKWQAILSICD